MAAICFCSLGSVDAGRVYEPPRVPRVAALERIDVEPNERVGVRLGHLFDVHAPLRREHEERLLRAAVERQREVVLALDVRRALDPDLRDGVAADVHAEDRARVRFRLVRRARELDPARLATPADEHLRLDDDRAAERLGRRTRLRRARREEPFGDRDPVAAEELLALILVQVQSAGESTASTPRALRSRVRASAREPNDADRPHRPRCDVRRIRARVERAAADR